MILPIKVSSRRSSSVRFQKREWVRGSFVIFFQMLITFGWKWRSPSKQKRNRCLTWLFLSSNDKIWCTEHLCEIWKTATTNLLYFSETPWKCVWAPILPQEMEGMPDFRNTISFLTLNGIPWYCVAISTMKNKFLYERLSKIVKRYC